MKLEDSHRNTSCSPLWPIRSINGWMHDKNWRICTKPNFACVSTKTGGLTDIRIGRRFFIKLVLFLMTFTKQEAIVLSQPTYAYISVAGKSNFRRVWLWNKNFASSSDEQKYYIMTCFRFAIDQRWRQNVLVAECIIDVVTTFWHIMWSWSVNPHQHVICLF